MYNKILVPLDGSEMSECSLEHVKAIASGCDAGEVVLLTVTGEEGGAAVTWGGAVSAEQLDRIERQARNAAIEYMKKVTDQLRAEGLNAGSVVLKGAPADAILDYAENNGVDLVIISTHGRSGASRWALGSVANHVLRKSLAPVMIVSPRGCRIN